MNHYYLCNKDFPIIAWFLSQTIQKVSMLDRIWTMTLDFVVHLLSSCYSHSALFKDCPFKREPSIWSESVGRWEICMTLDGKRGENFSYKVAHTYFKWGYTDDLWHWNVIKNSQLWEVEAMWKVIIYVFHF